jgi:hypothetical protein
MKHRIPAVSALGSTSPTGCGVPAQRTYRIQKNHRVRPPSRSRAIESVFSTEANWRPPTAKPPLNAEATEEGNKCESGSIGSRANHLRPSPFSSCMLPPCWVCGCCGFVLSMIFLWEKCIQHFIEPGCPKSTPNAWLRFRGGKGSMCTHGHGQWIGTRPSERCAEIVPSGKPSMASHIISRSVGVVNGSEMGPRCRAGMSPAPWYESAMKHGAEQNSDDTLSHVGSETKCERHQI